MSAFAVIQYIITGVDTNSPSPLGSTITAFRTLKGKKKFSQSVAKFLIKHAQDTGWAILSLPILRKQLTNKAWSVLLVLFRGICLWYQFIYQVHNKANI